MTDSEPVSNVNEEPKKTEQQETPITIGKKSFSLFGKFLICVF